MLYPELKLFFSFTEEEIETESEVHRFKKIKKAKIAIAFALINPASNHRDNSMAAVAPVWRSRVYIYVVKYNSK